MTTQVLLDPSDPTRGIIGNAAENVWGAQVGSAVLVNLHPANACQGQACVVHNPSQHHLRDWPLNWRGDIGVFERFCSHGVGHPDPDDLAYHLRRGQDWRGIHGCHMAGLANYNENGPNIMCCSKEAADVQ